MAKGLQTAVSAFKPISKGFSVFRMFGAKAQILLVVGGPLLFLIGVGAVSTFQLNKLDFTQSWGDHTTKVLKQADTIFASAVNMKTGLRGFLLAGKDLFLEPFSAGQVTTYETLESLLVTVSDNPPQVERLKESEAVLRQWQADVAQEQIRLRHVIGDALTMSDMAGRVRQGEGKADFCEFRGLVDMSLKIERNLMKERVAVLHEQV